VILDPGVGDAERCKPFLPLFKLVAPCHFELQVVEPVLNPLNGSPGLAGCCRSPINRPLTGCSSSTSSAVTGFAGAADAGPPYWQSSVRHSGGSAGVSERQGARHSGASHPSPP
jgi:hypothetical protein